MQHEYGEAAHPDQVMDLGSKTLCEVNKVYANTDHTPPWVKKDDVYRISEHDFADIEKRVLAWAQEIGKSAEERYRVATATAELAAMAPFPYHGAKTGRWTGEIYGHPDPVEHGHHETSQLMKNFQRHRRLQIFLDQEIGIAGGRSLAIRMQDLPWDSSRYRK